LLPHRPASAATKPLLEAGNRAVAELTINKTKNPADDHGILQQAQKANSQFLVGISKICGIIKK